MFLQGLHSQATVVQLYSTPKLVPVFNHHGINILKSKLYSSLLLVDRAHSFSRHKN